MFNDAESQIQSYAPPMFDLSHLQHLEILRVGSHRLNPNLPIRLPFANPLSLHILEFEASRLDAGLGPAYPSYIVPRGYPALKTLRLDADYPAVLRILDEHHGNDGVLVPDTPTMIVSLHVKMRPSQSGSMDVELITHPRLKKVEDLALTGISAMNISDATVLDLGV
jgi:hypothetical protein